MKTINEYILETATSFLGQKEKGNNAGFDNKEFQKRLEACGWERGQAWCAYFCELVYTEAYKRFAADNPTNKNIERVQQELTALFSGGATDTYARFDRSTWSTRNNLPVPGAMVVWRFGNGWIGHIAIVVEVSEKDNTITTIDGNSNNNGSREGNEVVRKVRKWKYPYSAKGLNIVGYIQPQNPDTYSREPFVMPNLNDKAISVTY